MGCVVTDTVVTILYLELSHHRGILFLIFSLSSPKFESAAEVSESLELLNVVKFTVVNLNATECSNVQLHAMQLNPVLGVPYT